jgi:hypothetical protein
MHTNLPYLNMCSASSQSEKYRPKHSDKSEWTCKRSTNLDEGILWLGVSTYKPDVRGNYDVFCIICSLWPILKLIYTGSPTILNMTEGKRQVYIGQEDLVVSVITYLILTNCVLKVTTHIKWQKSMVCTLQHLNYRYHRLYETTFLSIKTLVAFLL